MPETSILEHLTGRRPEHLVQFALSYLLRCDAGFRQWLAKELWTQAPPADVVILEEQPDDLPLVDSNWRPDIVLVDANDERNRKNVEVKCLANLTPRQRAAIGAGQMHLLVHPRDRRDQLERDTPNSLTKMTWGDLVGWDPQQETGARPGDHQLAWQIIGQADEMAGPGNGLLDPAAIPDQLQALAEKRSGGTWPALYRLLWALDIQLDEACPASHEYDVEKEQRGPARRQCYYGFNFALRPAAAVRPLTRDHWLGFTWTNDDWRLALFSGAKTGPSLEWKLDRQIDAATVVLDVVELLCTD